MDKLFNTLKALEKTALELNDVAEENLASSRKGLDGIEDEEMKGKINAISDSFEVLKKDKDISGMNELIIQLNKLMTELK